MQSLHPSLLLTTRDRYILGPAVERMATFGDLGYGGIVDYLTRRERLNEVGACGGAEGIHRFVLCVGESWEKGWVLKWGDPRYGLERNNTSELETYARLTSHDDPAIRLLALRHLAPVYDMGQNVIASPALAAIGEDLDIMPELSERALTLNIPDAHPGNAGYMLQPDGSRDLAFFDYGYCLSTKWTEDTWPQGPASAPPDIRAYWQSLAGAIEPRGRRPR